MGRVKMKEGENKRDNCVRVKSNEKGCEGEDRL